MAWIYKDSPLNQSEMENNADIIISYFRSQGYDDRTIAGMLGNIQAESTLSPTRHEVGGSGYGLVQWTPKSKLEEHCTTLGLSPYDNGDVQLQVIVAEILNRTGVAEWYTTSGFINNYLNSGATSDMIGVTGRQFLNNTMNWEPDKLAIMFMVGYERPSYDPSENHYERRKEYALKWYEYMGGTPQPPEPPTGKDDFIVLSIVKALKWSV